jgi:hypothetical protein
MHQSDHGVSRGSGTDRLVGRIAGRLLTRGMGMG